jgi:hypothetical protein
LKRCPGPGQQILRNTRTDGTESEDPLNPSPINNEWTGLLQHSAAKRHPKTTHKVRVGSLGIDVLEVREWFTYAAMETRKMTIKVHDTNHVSHELQIESDRPLSDLITLLCSRFGILEWHSVVIRRSDSKPFWIEDRGQYTITTQYDPDRDIRPSLRGRFDTLERIYHADDVRIALDGQAGDLVAALGTSGTLDFRRFSHAAPHPIDRGSTATKADGSNRRAPEDIGLPSMILYGAFATIRLWKPTPDTSGMLDSFDGVILNF